MVSFAAYVDVSKVSCLLVLLVQANSQPMLPSRAMPDNSMSSFSPHQSSISVPLKACVDSAAAQQSKFPQMPHQQKSRHQQPPPLVQDPRQQQQQQQATLLPSKLAQSTAASSLPPPAAAQGAFSAQSLPEAKRFQRTLSDGSGKHALPTGLRPNPRPLANPSRTLSSPSQQPGVQSIFARGTVGRGLPGAGVFLGSETHGELQTGAGGFGGGEGVGSSLAMQGLSPLDEYQRREAIHQSLQQQQERQRQLRTQLQQENQWQQQAMLHQMSR